MDNLGDILKEVRKQQQLSQLETAGDICSQSTLSEIEHNKYIPSTRLLINLCKKLSIVFDDLKLAVNFKICNEKYFNQKVSEFYKAQEYSQLKELLNRPTVLETVQTNKHIQAYYFYLAICEIKLEHKFDNAKEFLKLSLASTGRSHKQSTLTRMCNIALAYVYAKQGFKHSTFRQIKLSLRSLTEDDYEENLNLIFYIAALSYYQISAFDAAIEVIEQGINFIIENESHFMLINSLYLMATIAEIVKEDNTQLAIKSYDIFNAFIHERTLERVN